jgi:autotransporter-associated beta strand protein
MGAGGLLPATGAVTLSGTGALDLGGVDMSVGTFTLSGGTLLNGALRATSYTLNSGTISADLVGTASANKVSPGLVLLNGEIRSTGDVNVLEGTLKLGASERLSDEARLYINGGTFDMGNFSETVGRLRMRSANIVTGNNPGTLTAFIYELESGVISGALSGGQGGLVKVSDGSADGGLVVLNAGGTYTGITRVEAGTLRLGVVNALPVGTALTVAGGIFDLAGYTQQVGSFELERGTATGGTLFVGSGTVNVRDGLFDAVLSGGASVAKLGSGEVTLARANTYGGSTVLEAGRLVAGVSGALSTGTAVTVNGGAELALGATTQAVGGVVLNDGVLSGGALLSTGYTLKKGLVTSVLGGLGGLTKTTDAEVTLGNVNNYGGPTVL